MSNKIDKRKKDMGFHVLFCTCNPWEKESAYKMLLYFKYSGENRRI